MRLYCWPTRIKSSYILRPKISKAAFGWPFYIFLDLFLFWKQTHLRLDSPSFLVLSPKGLLFPIFLCLFGYPWLGSSKTLLPCTPPLFLPVLICDWRRRISRDLLWSASLPRPAGHGCPLLRWSSLFSRSCFGFESIKVKKFHNQFCQFVFISFLHFNISVVFYLSLISDLKKPKNP